MPTETCSGCGGATTVDGKICTSCMGTGGTGLAGVPRFLKEHVVDILTKSNNTLTKCNDALSKLVLLQTDVDIVEATTDGSSADIRDLQDRVDAIEEDMAAEIDVHVWFYNSITQGTFYTIVGPNHWRGRQMYNNPGVAGDRINYKVLMKAGTYDFRLVCTKGPAYGITRMYIDDVEKAAINTYASGVTHNTINVENGIVVAETGVKTVSLKVDGDFQMNVAAIMFHKVA